MKIYKTLLLALIATTTIMAACKKENTQQNELAKLPTVTQTGANTFGCLVNGKAWVAQNQDCAFICDPSFKMYYDGAGGENLTLEGFIKNTRQGIDQVLIISFDSTNFKSIHVYEKPLDMALTFRDYKRSDSCSYITSNDSATISRGTIILSRYDLAKGIISGTFEFTVSKPGCETIIVTNGRFDKQL